MGSMVTGEIRNGVVPLTGVIMFLLMLLWWAIEGATAGVRSLRDAYHAIDDRSPFMSPQAPVMAMRHSGAPAFVD